MKVDAENEIQNARKCRKYNPITVLKQMPNMQKIYSNYGFKSPLKLSGTLYFLLWWRTQNLCLRGRTQTDSWVLEKTHDFCVGFWGRLQTFMDFGSGPKIPNGFWKRTQVWWGQLPPNYQKHICRSAPRLDTNKGFWFSVSLVWDLEGTGISFSLLLFYLC